MASPPEWGGCHPRGRCGALLLGYGTIPFRCTRSSNVGRGYGSPRSLSLSGPTNYWVARQGQWTAAETLASLERKKGRRRVWIAVIIVCVILASYPW
jgi:hypothetical protein